MIGTKTYDDDGIEATTYVAITSYTSLTSSTVVGKPRDTPYTQIYMYVVVHKIYKLSCCKCIQGSFKKFVA